MINAVSNKTFPFQTQLRKNLNQQNEVLKRLATGLRINAGKDDPAGLIAGSRLQAEAAALDAENRALERLSANANITEGHLSQLSTMASELRRHTLAAANTGGLSDAERDAHQLQVDSLSARMQRFTYDAVQSLDGISLPNDGNAPLAEQLQSAVHAVSTLATGGANDLSSGNFEAAGSAIEQAITAFAEARGTVGAYQRNTLEPRMNSLAVQRENVLAAHSQIMDADFAQETSNLARSNVLSATSLQALRIANQAAGAVLSLLA